jgi:hypothetical protein
MDAKKCLTATVAGFVVMFVLAGLWHMVIMDEFYARHTYVPGREEPLLGYIGLGYLILAALMAYVYPKGYSGGSPVKEGLRFGALMGLLWILPHSTVLYGALGLGTRAIIVVDVIWHIVEEGIGGAVMGAIYGTIAPAKAEQSPAPATGGQAG